MAKKRRTRIDIINDILNVISQNKGRIKQTHLMYKVNLSHKLMKSYLEELISKDIIEEKKGENNIYLVMRDKGHEFIERFKKMKEFQDTFGL
jgi:predicted transcriptional regulator